jgi:hypothetical protein
VLPEVVAVDAAVEVEAAEPVRERPQAAVPPQQEPHQQREAQRVQAEEEVAVPPRQEPHQQREAQPVQAVVAEVAVEGAALRLHHPHHLRQFHSWICASPAD